MVLNTKILFGMVSLPKSSISLTTIFLCLVGEMPHKPRHHHSAGSGLAMLGGCPYVTHVLQICLFSRVEFHWPGHFMPHSKHCRSDLSICGKMTSNRLSSHVFVFCSPKSEEFCWKSPFLVSKNKYQRTTYQHLKEKHLILVFLIGVWSCFFVGIKKMTHASKSFISSNLWTQQRACNGVFENHRRTNTGKTNKSVIRFPALSSTKNPFSNTRLYQ